MEADLKKLIRREDIAYAKGLDFAVIMEAAMDSVIETADGCTVEPDGQCPHGHQSPLLILGMI